eukprot:TRINITY_DN46656_c0_g1_i1.p1 TRINITY_DN46656_c0_g1~~TRINITY_DN46656_c0_g1_i1.p1  ORF type:complete len:328 (+),score=36.70 TRINITY_DN46656_c0_g1_i1:97-1080(+)
MPPARSGSNLTENGTLMAPFSNQSDPASMPMPMPVFPEAPEDEDESASFSPQPLKPLLQVSLDISRDLTDTGEFFVRMARSVPSQSFGIHFEVNVEARRISILEDLPHLGLSRNDIVLSINSREPPTDMEKCCQVLDSSLSIELKMLPARGIPGGGNYVSLTPRSWFTCIPSDSDVGLRNLTTKTLLSASAPCITNILKGEFEVTVVRSSSHQQFGLSLTSEVKGARRKGDVSLIFFMEDHPKYEILKGDRLLAVNDYQTNRMDVRECYQYIKESSKVVLLIRRLVDPAPLGSKLDILEDNWNALAQEDTGSRKLCGTYRGCFSFPA